jgi:predicted P-loop ATPase
MRIADVSKYLKNIAMQSKRNPVLEWIHSREWDKEDRLEQLFDSVDCIEDFDIDLKKEMILKWLLSGYGLYSRDYSTDFVARGVLILQGKQRIGKTSFFKFIANNNHKFFHTIESFNPENKDDRILLNGYPIIELGELDSTLADKYSLSSFKALVTKSYEVIRVHYAPTSSEYTRRTLLCGTVNKLEILIDDENTRFWIIPIRRINFDILNSIDIQQIWAQIAEMFNNNRHDRFYHELSNESYQKLNKSNMSFEIPSSIDFALDRCFDENVHKGYWVYKDYAEILTEIGFPIQYHDRGNLTKLGKALRRKFGILESKHVDSGRKYRVPPFIQKYDTNVSTYGF